MIIHARSPECIHDTATPGSRQPASGCLTCRTDNPEYRQWCEFWDALPYVWQWDAPAPDSLFYGGHWKDRATGEHVTAEVVWQHLRGMGVTVL